MQKIPRLNRDMIITEKIDGTNAQIWIDLYVPPVTVDMELFQADLDGTTYYMLFGSRTRWLTAKNDNYNFCKWGIEHKDELVKLGVGRHFGEWWGSGINRGYGLPKDDKRFSLFNTSRWNTENVPNCVSVVPELCKWTFDTSKINETLHNLAETGSIAAPGFMNPEGIVVFHSAAQNLFKVTIKDDEKPKGKVNV